MPACGCHSTPDILYLGLPFCCRALAAARGNPDVVRGVGIATIAGGKFEGEGKEKDLREVLR